MKRVIFKVPADTEFDTLTEDQQEAINTLFNSYRSPMENSIVGTTKLIDACVDDSFDPSGMAALGLNWDILGLWQFDKYGKLINTIIPYNKIEVESRLSPYEESDREGNGITNRQRTINEAHNWGNFQEI